MIKCRWLLNLNNAKAAMKDTNNSYIVKYNDYDVEILKTDLNKNDENHENKIAIVIKKPNNEYAICIDKNGLINDVKHQCKIYRKTLFQSYDNISVKLYQAYAVRKKEQHSLEDGMWKIAVVVKEYDDYTCNLVPQFFIDGNLYDIKDYEFVPLNDDTYLLINNFEPWEEHVKTQLELYTNN